MSQSEQNAAVRGSLLRRMGDALTMGALGLLSRCPLRVLYGVSDWVLYPVLYHVARYRVRVVRSNLERSFAELSPAERRDIERRFYHYFCDLAMEIVKGATISGEELKRRVAVRGLEAVERTFGEHRIAVCYLGHYGNWEWLTVLPLYMQRGGMTQIYHPMRNKAFDRWFCDNRSRFGAINIPMKQTLRRLAALRAAMAQPGHPHEGYLLGCIADQLPKAENIHHYVTFFNQRTAVFTGSEKIGRAMDASFAYVTMHRPRRGYYEIEFQQMQAPEGAGECYYTDEFMRRLEQDIRRQPELWLWTHKRWKR